MLTTAWKTNRLYGGGGGGVEGVGEGSTQANRATLREPIFHTRRAILTIFLLCKTAKQRYIPGSC